MPKSKFTKEFNKVMEDEEVKKELKFRYQLFDPDGGCHKMAKKLSSFGNNPKPFMGGYLITHKGSQWFLRHSIGCELYWIPAEKVIPKGSLDDMYNRQKTDNEIKYFIENSDPEFMTTWLPNWRSMRCMKWLINNHPNLR